MKVVIAIAILASSSFLAACNTLNGIGKDVERAGQKVQGAARN
jgi:predicted small secreted protein